MNSAQLKNREYNLSQTYVGHPLKTLKGSTVKRSKFGVGKLIGGKLYFHRNYVDVIDQIASAADIDRINQIIESLNTNAPISWSCFRYDIKSGELVGMESPDFDTAREPVVGRILTVAEDGSISLSRFYNQIWHHKWLWVMNDYNGFNVAESWEWSKEWLSVLTEPADGSNEANWLLQLSRFDLD